MEKHLEFILREMCDRVGVNYDSIDFQKDNWYMQYTWTPEEEEDFKNWMIDYLYNNTKARKEIMRFPRKNKKEIEKVVLWWNVSYGWKTKQIETEKDAHEGNLSIIDTKE